MQASEYSEKEKKLLTAYGFEALMNNSSISPYTLYRMAEHRAFMENRGDKAEASLRRLMAAWDSGKIFRRTAAWDNLIEL